MRRVRRAALALALAEGLVFAARAEAPKVMPTDPAGPQSLTPRPKEALKGQLRELPTPYSIGATGAVPPRSKTEPDIAFGAYQRGQYTTAFREATKRIAADNKDAAAMTLLGELYNQGLGVKQDPVKAAEWYRLAANQGDTHAMASLGLMSIDGRGGTKDPKAGRRWLEQASAKGDTTAAYNLALILIGTGTEPDEAKAAELFRKAAEGEIGPAQHDLGVLYLQGRGCRRIPNRRPSGSGAPPITAISPVRSNSRSFCSTASASRRTRPARPATSSTPRRAATPSRRIAWPSSMPWDGVSRRTLSRLLPGILPPPPRGAPTRSWTRPSPASPPRSAAGPSDWPRRG